MHYSVKGANPYWQASALQLLGENGQQYDSQKAPERTYEDLYSFVREYPPIPKNQSLQIVTYEIEVPEILREMEIKIPLQ